ncbi:HAD-IA family hydrolase [Nocardiopsis flavescens]|uniref:Haloacid dehalogenase superfamily, subfamily IA, variant 1 with third motif having Dx(3-4)D or Dx(3-4)E n=1 Tax=Nocardiopsis flavescens TaxID=758803 RepID=A0A1M6MRA8_9ACTN|nr:HAD-IA family hydrolase [Nocardiopsis flavescens]SHJ85823.1 haloacid dehalogenase superfamily, subfamily IA, variant 1 with third motif having Dx(3-4)D or Dx(3-4)E [Nocardiopsis flavescens]
MDPTPALSRRPDALLLDFGGVVFQTRKLPGGRDAFALHLRETLLRAGHDVPAADLRASLDAGLAALKDWKNAAGRRRTPRELTHREIWTDFLASDLPDPVRETLAGSAGPLLADMSTLLSEHRLRPGIRDLLHAARTLGVRVGIVSNAHSGRAHRSLLREAGLQDRVGVQVYSDEVGIRKPHPEMIALAARALGTVPERCWYVGDTQDRDVVAGRRAGAAAVVLTRHHHTDTPPYPVRETADAVFDTPEGLVDPLWHSVPEQAADLVPAQARTAAPGAGEDDLVRVAPPRAYGPAAARRALGPGGPGALLLDQGGVIAVSSATPGVQRDFAASLARRLDRAGYATTTGDVLSLVRTGRDRYRDWKAGHDEDGPIPEITPRAFWHDMVGRDLPERARAFLYAESAQLTLEYADSKSLARMRTGVREVLEHCAEHGIPVAVVSNTVCGRAVREELDRFGIAHLIGAHVYSDELGHRKPDPATVRSALTALDADPARTWFVGDKPWRDTAAARRSGVGTAVVVRGGSASDERIEQALTGGDPLLRPDHVIDEMGDLLRLWTGAPAPLAP